MPTDCAAWTQRYERTSPPIAPEHELAFTLNGEHKTISVRPGALLIDVLRDAFGLTGTKEGCGIGVCGSCSVLVDGRLMSACLILARGVDGSTVRTIEGVAREGTPAALGDSFVECGGLQCGICTPGQIVAATALLSENPNPSDEEVKEWMTGNLCRCTGYYQIVESVRAAAQDEYA